MKSVKTPSHPLPTDLDETRLAARIYHWTTTTLPLPLVRKLVNELYELDHQGSETRAQFVKRVMAQIRAYRKAWPREKSKNIRAAIAKGMVYRKGQLFSRACAEVRDLRFHDPLPDGTRLRIRPVRQMADDVPTSPKAATV